MQYTLPDLSDRSLNPSRHSSGSVFVHLFLFELFAVDGDGESGSTFNSEAATAALLLAAD